MRMSPRHLGSKLLTPTRPGAPSHWPQRITHWIAALVIGSCPVSQLSAAPPARPQVAAQRQSGFANFLFGPSAKTRQAAPVRPSQPSSNITVFHPEYRAFTPSPQAGTSSPPPNGQAPEIEIRRAVQKGAATNDSRSRLTLPVSSTGPTVQAPARIEIAPSPPNPGVKASAEPPRNDAGDIKPLAKTLPPVPENPKYATPVFGKRGYVRPPGASESAYMLDVQGMPPGAKARDPHTGLVFLVPPF
jgi:hypothetical protein